MDSSKRELRLVPAVPPADRVPLPVRRRRARVAAAARAIARTTRPLSPEQRALDPLVVDRKGSRTRWLRALRATVGSLLVHAAIVGFGFLTGAGDKGQREKVEQTIKVEVREPPPLPPQPAQVEAPAPPVPAPPKVAKAPPPKAAPEPPPEQPPDAPPPRVVGISMESTTEGGGGPSFAVGNTRAGKTADKAVDPSVVPTEAPAEPAPGTNAVASRLPSAGVRYVPPRRLREPKLRYPDTLKVQGLEADVKVSLSINATGKVVAVKILTPSPYPEFNDEAKATGLREEFEPATRDGNPIPYSLPFTYRFRLQDE